MAHSLISHQVFQTLAFLSSQNLALPCISNKTCYSPQRAIGLSPHCPASCSLLLLSLNFNRWSADPFFTLNSYLPQSLNFSAYFLIMHCFCDFIAVSHLFSYNQIFREKNNPTTSVCNVCQFLWCNSSHHPQFYTTKVTEGSLKVMLTMDSYISGKTGSSTALGGKLFNQYDLGKSVI